MDILKSKKFIASVLASGLALAGFYLGLSPAEVAVVVGPLGAYTVSQGMADFGKERAKIEDF